MKSIFDKGGLDGNSGNESVLQHCIRRASRNKKLWTEYIHVGHPSIILNLFVIKNKRTLGDMMKLRYIQCFRAKARQEKNQVLQQSLLSPSRFMHMDQDTSFNFGGFYVLSSALGYPGGCLTQTSADVMFYFRKERWYLWFYMYVK